jgi:hypothetical protein
MVLAVAGLVLALTAAAPVDVNGKWEGKLTGQRGDGTAVEEGALLILVQKDTTITGTVGGSETDQNTITKGAIDGNKVSLVVERSEGRQITIELTVDGDEMKGTITMGERRAQLALKRKA